MADTGRFRQLALHLAQGGTLRDAAQRASVPERTAYRVAKNPKFRRLVRKCRSRLWKSLAGQLVAASADAIATLRKVATSDESPATARVAACRTIIDSALKLKDQIDVDTRLRVLEERLAFDGPLPKA
jgi:hypothetical protein